MRLYCLLLLWAASLSPAAGKDPVKTNPPSPSVSLENMKLQWKKCSAGEGLSLYWAKVEGSQVIAFRGEGIVDAPIEKVASILMDTTRSTEWIDSLVSSNVVRTLSPAEFIEYDHAGIPFPFDTLMRDRDFVSHVTLETEPKNQRLILTYKPAEDEQAPPLKKYVRGTMSCEFKMTRMSLADETYVEAEIYCDPKGTVPPWVVNFFQQGWPQTTFERLRKQTGKKDIQISPLVEQFLQKPAAKLIKSSKD